MRERRSKGFGSIRARRRRDGTIAYMLKVTFGGRDYVRTVAAKSKKEAGAMLPAFVAEIQSGETERKKQDAERLSKQPTLAEWSGEFLASHVKQDADRAATRAAYASMIRLYILPALGAYKLSEIEAPMIRDAMQALRRKGRALRTIKLAYAVMHRCFDAAVEDGLLNQNPMQKFSKLHLGENEGEAESAKRHALTAAQVTALLSACADDPKLHLFVSIGASTGLRPGEISGLRRQDVDLKASVIHVRGSAKRVHGGPGEGARVWIGDTKTKSSRRDVGIGPALTALFVAHFERMEAMQRELRGLPGNVATARPVVPAEACVFCADPATAEGLRAPRSPHTIRAQFKRALARAGLPDNVSPHWLRHTAISHAIANGTPLADAAKRAGHKNPAITAAIYTHAVGDGEKKAAAIGDSLLTSGKSAEIEQNGMDKGLK